MNEERKRRAKREREDFKNLDKLIEKFKKENLQEASNKKLNKAQKLKNDEFYTSYEDIERELKHYSDKFENKVIYLPCDDPYQLRKFFSDSDEIASKFWVYFHKNFSRFKLKKLMATFKMLDGSNSYLYEYTGGVDKNVWDYKWTQLTNDGDFRNLDNFKFFKEADIVVTNPPFSIFNDFYRLLKLSQVDFIVLGNFINFSSNSNLLFDLVDKKVFLGLTNCEYFFDYKMTEKGDITKIKKNAMTEWYTTFNTNNLITENKNEEKYKWSYIDDKTIHMDEFKYLNEVAEFHDENFLIPVTGLRRILNDKRFEILGTGKENKLNVKYEPIIINNKQRYRRLLIRKRKEIKND